MKFIDLFDKVSLVPDWEKIEAIKEFADMKSTPQSQTWHKEGNVWEHTKLVTQNMFEFLDKRGFDRIEARKTNPYYIRMMSAAICHDLGKVGTTYFNKEKNDYSTKNHGVVGEKITRRLFFDDDIIIREEVCYMVRWHMILHHLIGNDKMYRKAIQLSYGRVTFEDMFILNMCDTLGSINDQETDADKVWKAFDIERLGHTFSLMDQPFHFPNEETKRTFFTDPNQNGPSFEKPLSSVKASYAMFVMIGCPGSGKDYFIEHFLKDIPMLCRDNIRTEIGLKGEKPMGNKEQENKVTDIFNARLAEYNKNNQSFVINNTNVRRFYRDGYTKATLDKMPRIVYVYVEADTIEEEKERRKNQMPLSVIDRMWNQLDFPDKSEYDDLIIVKGDKIYSDLWPEGTTYQELSERRNGKGYSVQ